MQGGKREIGMYEYTNLLLADREDCVKTGSKMATTRSELLILLCDAHHTLELKSVHVRGSIQLSDTTRPRIRALSVLQLDIDLVATSRDLYLYSDALQAKNFCTLGTFRC